MWSFEEEHPFALAYKLVEEGKLDPWDVDISTLAKAYMEEIKRLELLDLRVPARAVLAASFLLKKQTEALFPEPKQKRERKKLTLQEIVEQFESQQENLEEELSEKLEKVRKAIRKVHVGVRKERRRERKFPVHISKFEDALAELRELLKGSGASFSFYDLVLSKNIVPYLMALMVMYQEGEVNIRQEKPYSDLIIECLGVGNDRAEV
ncbi:MAG: segregation/condensation protein A [Aquificaceae bacterium]|nr:segregation/condensation protein A [Aquificaceae bacterium]MCS7307992.1 segregation/condensation protein A [Aquificaceae bacterium]MCX8075524.1 segregation/condensation protein A [Aquificaceae bacterium]MDW8095946.1 segregation/condensation protein A [Aquificaceae bacterium]MDW8433405.1 segregation/condensation protein A [Aquificaceae bacterium]